MALKVGLINPFNSFLSDKEGMAEMYRKAPELSLVRFFRTGPVLALLTLAGAQREGVEYHYVDETHEPVDFDRPYDIVAMSLMALQAPRAYKMAAEFRKRGVHVVLGGLHPTVLPEEAQQHCDSVFVGESDLTWKTFIQDYKNGNPKSLYMNKEMIDMEKLPPPDYSLIAHMTHKYPDVPIQISRGCPHNCSFCTASQIYGFRYRKKSIPQVLRELEQVLSIYPKKPSIWFTDDNMLTNKTFAKELLTALIPYRIIWHTQTDLSLADDDELLTLVRKSGGRRILIGLESVKPDNLRALDRRNWKYRKQQSKRGYLDALEKIQSFGIGVVGAFMVGLENDTEEIFDQTIEFMQKAHIYGSQTTILTPMPGTEIFNRYKAEGRILHEDWSKYTYLNVNFKHKNLSKKQLEDGLYRIYQTMYSDEFFRKKAYYFKEAMRNRKVA